MNYYETFGSYVFPYSSDEETKKEHNFARDLFRLVSMSKRKYLLCSNNYWVGCYALDFNSWINILSKSEEKRTRKTHTSVENRLGHEYEIQLMDENFLFRLVIYVCVFVCILSVFLSLFSILFCTCKIFYGNWVFGLIRQSNKSMGVFRNVYDIKYICTIFVFHINIKCV